MEHPRPRKWWIKSVSDPRWNTEGWGVCTRFEAPEEALKIIEKLEKEYGDRPPDFKFGYFE